MSMKTKSELKGSPSRDAFNLWHKTPPMPKSFYASDLDFVLVEKAPPRIVAIIDYKRAAVGVVLAHATQDNARGEE